MGLFTEREMTIQKELGERAERLAVAHLKNLGYRILETNWRYKRAEIDVIAMDNEILVCVEVKSRSYDYFGPPETSIGRKKERLLIEALQTYMEEINHQWEIRFDIIAIVFHDQASPSLRHLRDAFFPGLSP